MSIRVGASRRRMPVRRALVVFVLGATGACWGLGVLPLFGVSAAGADAMARSGGSVPPLPAGSHAVGALPGANALRVDVVLRPRDPERAGRLRRRRVDALVPAVSPLPAARPVRRPLRAGPGHRRRGARLARGPRGERGPHGTRRPRHPGVGDRRPDRARLRPRDRAVPPALGARRPRADGGAARAPVPGRLAAGRGGARRHRRPHPAAGAPGRALGLGGDAHGTARVAACRTARVAACRTARGDRGPAPRPRPRLRP